MVVAEGTQVEGLEVPSGGVDKSDEFGHVRLAERGIAQVVANEVKQRTGIDTRITVLGHLQRGGTPSVRDRYYSMLLGSAAVDFFHRDIFGCMTALKGQEIVPVPLADIAGKTWSVPPEVYELGRRFFRTVAALESPTGT